MLIHYTAEVHNAVVVNYIIYHIYVVGAIGLNIPTVRSDVGYFAGTLRWQSVYDFAVFFP